MSKILPANPSAACHELRAEILQALEGVVDGGFYILGDKVCEFEEAFAEWMGGGYCVGVANGTDALELCIRALGLGEGALIALPSHTAVATATAVVRAGAIPLLIDIDPDSFLLDLRKLEEAIMGLGDGKKLASVIPVHLYGRACDMGEIARLAARYDFKIIEDCSQAHGAIWGEGKVGTYGDAAAFSCYPTKNLGALGDAGLAYSSDARVAERIRHLRQYGWKTRYVSDEVGMNSRLDEMQAAILCVYLRHLDRWNARRQEIARLYLEGLAELPLKLPQLPDPPAAHVFHQFTVRTGRRDALLKYLVDRDIIPALLYPQPIHLQPAYRKWSESYPFPRGASEAACSELLCLPMYPQLTDAEVESVNAVVRAFFS